MKTALITGGSSGIGQTLAWELAKKEFKLFIVGRNKQRLAETAQKYPNNITILSADISTQSGREELLNQFIKETSLLDYIIHNAAYEGPLRAIADMSLDEWRYTHATNLEAPVFITKKLLTYLNPLARILLVSSGLAYEPMENASAYCTSKAALHMLAQCLNVELNRKEIYTGVLLPGVVDTPMQARLRAIDKKHFPRVEAFRNLKETGQLISPKKVAEYIVDVLLNTKQQDFIAKVWDIMDQQ